MAGLVGIYFEFRYHEERRSQLTSTALANIDKVDVVRSVSPITGQEGTAYIIVTFSYSVENAEYQKTLKMGSAEAAQFVPWSTAKICYDSENSETLENPLIFPIGHECGK